MAGVSMREAYGKALAKYGGINPDIVVLDVDTSASTLSNLFAQRYPDRFINVGIAEPCLIDVAAGLALGGLIPFVNVFAALVSLRAAEQVRTCVCYARTNVKIAAGYAGLSDYKDGPTHFSISDIAIMRALPEMTIIVPADSVEVAKWVPVIAEYDGPVYLRISRDATIEVNDPSCEPRVGRGMMMRDGSDLTIIAAGSMVGRSLLAAEQLSGEGIYPRVINMPSIKPLDHELILQAAEETGAIITAEEHSIIGGLGGAVAELVGEHKPVRLKRIGVNDIFTRTAMDPDSLLDAYGLGVNDIVCAAKQLIDKAI